MMFYTQEISAFTHGRVTASRLIGSTPHDQLLIQISDSFSGLLLFAIGLLLLMAAFVKDGEFHGFFAKGRVALHVMMAVWRVYFVRSLEDLAGDLPRQKLSDAAGISKGITNAEPKIDIVITSKNSNEKFGIHQKRTLIPSAIPVEPLLTLILGRDVSGEVAVVGASVRSLNVGQEVFGALHPTAARGTYTDYAILPESELAKKPEQMSHMAASAIPFVALTAWRALKSTAKITEGQRVLILGGVGAVGFSAVQIAVAAGCYVASTRGVESIDRVLAAGAEQAIDYTSEDIETLIKGKFDAVLDVIGGPDIETLGTNFLFKGGCYMTLQGESASYADSYGLILDYSWVYMRADPEGLQEIRRLCDTGKFNIPVEKTYPITQVREAHKAKDKRIIIGKVVLEVD
ncbi:unnamed protein product [Rhodiola kirilowii]